MNDNFKFRVWDTENESFQEKYADDCFIRHDGRLVCVFWGDDSRPTSCVDEGEAIVEMCIGLKDKNGNLIFCGDVLHDGECLKEVCWSESLASYMLDDYSYNANGEYTGSGQLLTIHFYDLLNMEIVGNIHEGVKK